jgi:cysteine desulfurase/selenocysteine lyase
MDQTDPVAALGVSPSGSVPDVTQVSDTITSAAGVGGVPAPETPVVPGFTGLQLARPGELTPGVAGLSLPLPSAGLPGIPGSDQVASGAGLPGGSPDPTVLNSVSTAAPIAGPPEVPFGIPGGGIVAPDMPVVPAVPGVSGALPGVPPLDAARVPFAVPDAGPATPEVPAVPQVPVTPGSPGTSDLPAGLLSDPSAMGTPSVPQPPVTGMRAADPDPIAPVPTPSTPFYFLAESSPYRPVDATALDADRDAGLDTLAAAALSPVPIEPLHESYHVLDRPEVPAAAGDPANPGAVPTGGYPAFDVNLVRRDFPILSERVNGRPLIWLDNAATTQKPQAVLDRLAHFYRHENSNIHRAAHELAARATDAYEGARKTVARFIGAGSHQDIVFVRGATEAINLVAKSWGKANIRRGDEIVISHLEHHANIVPWQQLISETGAVLRVIPVDDTGQILLDEYATLLSDKTKLVAVTQVSNALGTVTPVEKIVELGHRAGARVLIDGAQSVPHLRVNMQAMGADFFVFSGHKIFAPTGIGVLYGRPEVLESMPPWEGGGNMIVDVTFEKTTYQDPPARFEAGTGNIADAVGLGAALDYVTRVGLENIAAYEHSLLEYATPRLRQVSGLRLIGTARDKASVMSFVLDGYRPEQVGAALNQEGIAVRSGHHCAQPILRRFGVEATVRPSVAFYNTCQEIDVLIAALHRLAADRGRR